MVSEVILPQLNVSRRMSNGLVNPYEKVNQQVICATSAGSKTSYAYEKLIELVIKMVIEPDEAFVLGGTRRVPVLEGLLQRTFVNDLKTSGTYNDASFAREYESEWSGDAENAYFSVERFDKYRVLLQPEYEYSGRSNKSAYYVIGVDVGRKGCTTEAVVIKVTPQTQGASLKSVVNIYTFTDEHFED